MGPRTLRLLSVTLALLWMPSHAGAITKGVPLWWGSTRPIKQPAVTTPALKPKLPDLIKDLPVLDNAPVLDTGTQITAEGITPITAELVQVLGSTPTYEGKVVSFENLKITPTTSTFCTAIVAVDYDVGPKAFRTNISLDPRYPRSQNVNDVKMLTYMESHIFHLNMLCRQLQAAFLNNQKVLVTGQIESLGDSGQNTIGALRVQRLKSMPEGVSSVDDLPPATVCLEGIDCIVDGVPESFFVEAGRFDIFVPFCQPTWKINSGGTDQKLKVFISYEDYSSDPGERRMSMQALDSMCDVMLKAMGSTKPIGIVGRGVGGWINANRISSPRLIPIIIPPLLF